VRAVPLLLAAALVTACSGRAGTPDRRVAEPPTPPTSTSASTSSTSTSTTAAASTTVAPSTTAPVEVSTPARGPNLYRFTTTAPARQSPSATTAPRSPLPTGSPAGPPAPVVLAAGDIASCSSTGDESTANLLDHLDGQIVTLGDHAYERGTASEFAGCYGPTWGRHRGRTHPTRGNHDIYTSGGAPYTAYFGGVARWYSWDLAGWHLIALDSNAPSDPAQLQWLRGDLAAHASATCTLAYWHHPRWSSGTHGSDVDVAPLWDALAAAHADVVLAGHDHDYERFAPIDGIRSFVVGTGGRSHYRFTKAPLAETEVRDDTSFGVLELTLHASSYDWRFVAATGGFADSGSGACR
jgi:hypothetical protein